MIEEHPIKLAAKIKLEGDIYSARLVLSSDWLGVGERSVELPERYPNREAAIAAVVDLLAARLLA